MVGDSTINLIGNYQIDSNNGDFVFKKRLSLDIRLGILIMKKIFYI
jgi:hypothetical protein